MVGAATGTSSRSASTGGWARETMDGWITHRLIGEGLERLALEADAGESPPRR